MTPLDLEGGYNFLFGRNNVRLFGDRMIPCIDVTDTKASNN